MQHLKINKEKRPEFLCMTIIMCSSVNRYFVIGLVGMFIGLLCREADLKHYCVIMVIIQY